MNQKLICLLLLLAAPLAFAASIKGNVSDKAEKQQARQARADNRNARAPKDGKETPRTPPPPPFFKAPKLSVAPQQIQAHPGQEFPLEVDGDISAIRTWSSDEAVAFVKEGRIHVQAPGYATLSIRLGDKYAVIPVEVTQEIKAVFPETNDSHPIDAAVNKQLRHLGIIPSELCSDQEYLRRICIDLMGVLPSPDLVRRFTEDSSPGKRAKLVDWIFEQEEYADYWAMRWCDLLRVKSEFPSNLWPNAVQTYHAWIRDAMTSNMPYDQFTRELLTSSGSNFRVPPVNFYRAFQKRTPQNIAASAAQIFMGMRMGCIHCDDHAHENWSAPWLYSYATFFTGIRYKKTDEWKEEIVFFGPWIAFKDPDTKENISPWLPGVGYVPLVSRENPRKIFADWLAQPNNPYFAQHVANRYWAIIFGRGITHPADDVRPNNPPTNPELLAHLAQFTIDNHFDLRALIRHIVTSQTYQRSSRANEWNKNDSQSFSHYKIRRLESEVLADAIGGITGQYESFNSRIPEPFSFWPNNFRSQQMPDASVTTGFLETFGRPARDTSLESERNINRSLAQALYLFNSDAFIKKLNNSKGNVRKMAADYAQNPAGFVDECYLLTLSRLPTEKEKAACLDYINTKGKKLTDTAPDLLWALINTKEFLYNH